MSFMAQPPNFLNAAWPHIVRGKIPILLRMPLISKIGPFYC